MRCPARICAAAADQVEKRVKQRAGGGVKDRVDKARAAGIGLILSKIVGRKAWKIRNEEETRNELKIKKNCVEGKDRSRGSRAERSRGGSAEGGGSEKKRRIVTGSERRIVAGSERRIVEGSERRIVTGRERKIEQEVSERSSEKKSEKNRSGKRSLCDHWNC